MLPRESRSVPVKASSEETRLYIVTCKKWGSKCFLRYTETCYEVKGVGHIPGATRSVSMNTSYHKEQE